MKLSIVSLLSLVIFYSAGAQNDDIKGVAGDWSAEVNLAPWGSNPIRISGIRLRKFKESSAIRLIVFTSHLTEKPVEDFTRSYTEISLKPGIEKHFAGTDRLSPYIGGEVEIAFKTSRAEFTGGTSSFELQGGWDEFGTEQGYFRLGANFIIGCDYYFAKSLYLGTEFGFGFSHLKSSDLKSDALAETIEGGTTFQVGPNANSSIRLGFLF